MKAQKNDNRDAKGIAEAVSRRTMRFVELKSDAQLDIQTLRWAAASLVDTEIWCLSEPESWNAKKGQISREFKHEAVKLAKERGVSVAQAARDGRFNRSTQQISGWLKVKHDDDGTMQVPHETIYRSLFIQARSVLNGSCCRICGAHASCGAQRHQQPKGRQ